MSWFAAMVSASGKQPHRSASRRSATTSPARSEPMRSSAGPPASSASSTSSTSRCAVANPASECLTRHDDLAAGAARQQRPDLSLARRVIENYQRSTVPKQRPVQARRAPPDQAELLRCSHPAPAAAGPTRPASHRLGIRAAQIDEELAVRKMTSKPVAGRDGKRRLTDAPDA